MQLCLYPESWEAVSVKTLVQCIIYKILYDMFEMVSQHAGTNPKSLVELIRKNKQSRKSVEDATIGGEKMVPIYRRRDHWPGENGYNSDPNPFQILVAKLDPGILLYISK